MIQRFRAAKCWNSGRIVKKFLRLISCSFLLSVCVLLLFIYFILVFFFLWVVCLFYDYVIQLASSVVTRTWYSLCRHQVRILFLLSLMCVCVLLFSSKLRFIFHFSFFLPIHTIHLDVNLMCSFWIVGNMVDICNWCRVSFLFMLFSGIAIVYSLVASPKWLYEVQGTSTFLWKTKNNI